MQEIWADRAAAAEAGVVARHVRRLWGLPGTALGVVAHPPTVPTRAFLRWDYWWQAHLIDCSVDAFLRAPSAGRRRRTEALVRGVRVRNLGSWRNRYFDDMAWLGLALHRAGEGVGVRRPAAVDSLGATLRGAWSDAEGGIPWRVGDTFRNVPANGPAAILAARTGHLDHATATVDWIGANLTDGGLVLDGVRPGGVLVRALYTYNQGTVLGAETELAVRTGAPRHAERVVALVAAVAETLADDDVLRTHGGGDGGLFSGILARYLALVATTLPGDGDASRQARTTATRLVLRSARSVWSHRDETDGAAVFGADWDRGATGPEGDLSVQLGAWMLLEAAARVCTPR